MPCSDLPIHCQRRCPQLTGNTSLTLILFSETIGSLGAGMDLGLSGRVAIVAAASTGLGFAVAQELSREGADVAICARTASDLQSAAAKIQGTSGREVIHQAVDVTNANAVAAFVSAVERRFGHIDICITNSGGPPSKLFEETASEDWKAAIDLLLMSAVFFARETLPRMKKNRWGRLITVTSYAVKQPVDGLLLSNSIRAAVTGLARTLANEYGAYGITVNNVCPGYTRTDRLGDLAKAVSARTGAKPDDVFAGWERQIPAGRIGTPEEFAAVVAFLASERASYVNGTSIAVDGGIVRSLL
jgi:3-oxoacyl-[acyl-carrier protein] reductase